MNSKNMKFDSNTFDVVFFIEVYEHLYRHEAISTLKVIKRVIKSSGIVLFHTAPNKYFNDYFYKYWCYPVSCLFIGLNNLIFNKNYPRLLKHEYVRNYRHKLMHVNEPTYFEVNKVFKDLGFTGNLMTSNITTIKPVLSWKDKLFNNIVYLHPLGQLFPFNIIFGNDFLSLFRIK
jgi:predicted SAM-dependent methyltransferase